jgi:spore photoproduct lyase
MAIQARFNLDDKTDEIMTLIMDSEKALRDLASKGTGEKLRYRNSKSNLSIEFENFKGLSGKKIQKFKNLSDGSIITLFDKTPPPKGKNDVVCPHFVELKWANGCNFDCSWCYLNGTLRFRPMGKKPYMKSKTKIVEHIKNYFEQNALPSLMNSGELSDSLVFEGNGYALSKFIIPLFKIQNKHKLLILTKSANVKGILSSSSKDYLIASFSLNSFEVAKRWEKKAPSPKQRIMAAKKLHNAGYTVRIRIDPVVPVENWEQGYKDLIDHLFKNIVPERITIGSLRGLQSTINNSKDKSWVNYLDDSSNWGKKISFKKRFQMYGTIINHLNKEYEFINVGLCKETVGMWNKLGMDYENIKCNCIL